MDNNKVPAIFRYPGGKSRLLPAMAPTFHALLAGQHDYHDVCVGGGSTLFWVAQNYPKVKLFANDKNHGMACFYQIVSQAPELLCARLNITPTVPMFYRIKKELPDPTAVTDWAFRALFLNRCSHSGLGIKPIGGDSQKSLYPVGCRYNPSKLKQEIIRAHELLKDRLTVHCGPVADYLDSCPPRTPIYVDPPYYHQSRVNQLYEVSMLTTEHEELATKLKRLKRWVLSYDDRPEIRALYAWAKITQLPARYSINGPKTNWEHKVELIIQPG